MRKRWRRGRRGNRGRTPSPVLVSSFQNRQFTPQPPGEPEPVTIQPGELEVIKLVDLQGLSQKQTGQKMKTSRGTVWRLLQTARKKVAKALTEGRKIIIQE